MFPLRSRGGRGHHGAYFCGGSNGADLVESVSGDGRGLGAGAGRGLKARHARARRGHPRFKARSTTAKDVDGRDKPGHDERWLPKVQRTSCEER